MKFEKPSVVDALSELGTLGFLRPGGSPFAPPKIKGSAVKERTVESRPFSPDQLPFSDEIFGELDLTGFLDHISSVRFNPETVGRITKTKGWDAAAWYCPVHFYSYEWGIYVRVTSVYEIALDILHACGSALAQGVLNAARSRVSRADHPDLPDERREQSRHYMEVGALISGHSYRSWLDGTKENLIRKAIKAAYFILYHHELFHHFVEAFGTRFEIITDRPVYVSYADSVYKPAKGTPHLIEEALANAFSYRAVQDQVFEAFLSRRPHEGFLIKDASRRYLEERFPNDPPGYNQALEFASDHDFERGLGLLIMQMKQANRTPLGIERAVRIASAEYSHLFADDEIRCVEISEAGTHRILRDTILPFDNKGKRLQKLLQKHGYTLIREGKHQVWRKVGCRQIPVPRTNFISDGTAESVLKLLSPTYRLRDFERIAKAAA